MFLRSTGLVLLTAVIAFIMSPPAMGAQPSPGPRPNIVLIISDDHGWTDYSFMGHPQVRTPRLDALASQGLVYSRGYVPSSLCCPSLASIITGLYPHQHRITSNDPPIPAGMTQAEFYKSPAFTEGRERMNRHLEAVPTLPRLLAQEGYLSFQAGKWWQGDYRRGGFTHGMTRGDRHGDDGLTIGRQTLQPIFDFINLAGREQKPFFLWYAPMLPHQPHNPPERLLKKYRDIAPSIHVARYWAMVEWFDETCGQLLDHLDSRKLSENTLVLYVADNGWIQSPAEARPVRSKLTPYDAGLRTPILLRWPGRVKSGRSEALAMSIDLVPTILAALGLPPHQDMQGISLLDDNAPRQRRAIFGECFSHNAVDLDNPSKNLLWRWAIAGQDKLIVPADATAPAELYDLGSDPGEASNRIGQRGERARELREMLDAWWNPASPR